jgi:hypothetical protein
MLFVDAGSEIIGIAVFVLVLLIIRPDKERLPDVEPVPPDEARIVAESTDR